MSVGDSWVCPFCGTNQVQQKDNYSAGTRELSIGQTAFGTVGLGHTAIRCLNGACGQVTLSVRLNKIDYGGYNNTVRSIATIYDMMIAPRSEAKAQPEFIPAVIREDYTEACLIRDDSPKASATLSRRALQGMIRDFCGISEKTLWAEITKLESMLQAGTAPKGVEEETIAAIHAIRKIGNIGAHMEADINVIVDVDAGEAQALIELLELLFEEWYVARRTRQQRLARILEIEGAKEALKTGAVTERPALSIE